MKRSILLALIFVFSVTVTLLCSHSIASDRLYYENFDDRVINQAPFGTVMARKISDYSNPAVLGEYTWATGRGGSGYAFASGSIRDPFIEWRNLGGTWPTNEFYVSFWVRYPTYAAADTTHWNIKTFYPHWNGTDSYVHYSATGPKSTTESFYHSVMSNGEILLASAYPQTPNAWDGNWHQYEFYVHFTRGISRFWFDGVLRRDDNFGTGVWTNAMNYFTFGGQDSTDANTFTREIDDIEVWDGMPNEDPRQPPSVVTGVHIVE